MSNGTISALDTLEKRQYNVPWEAFKGALSELFREGLPTVLFAGAVGAAIAGLALGGAALTAAGIPALIGSAPSVLPFVGAISAATAGLSALFVAGKGALEGIRESRMKNALLEHSADLITQEATMMGRDAQIAALEETKAAKSTPNPEWLQNIIAKGQKASPVRKAREAVQQANDNGFSV